MARICVNEEALPFGGFVDRSGVLSSDYVIYKLQLTGCVCITCLSIPVKAVDASDASAIETDPSVPSKEDIPTFDEWKKQVMEVEKEKSKKHTQGHVPLINIMFRRSPVTMKKT